MRILHIILSLLFMIGVWYAVVVAFGWLGFTAYILFNVLCFLHGYETAKREAEEQQRAAGTWWTEL